MEWKWARSDARSSEWSEAEHYGVQKTIEQDNIVRNRGKHTNLQHHEKQHVSCNFHPLVMAHHCPSRLFRRSQAQIGEFDEERRFRIDDAVREGKGLNLDILFLFIFSPLVPSRGQSE